MDFTVHTMFNSLENVMPSWLMLAGLAASIHKSNNEQDRAANVTLTYDSFLDQLPLLGQCYTVEVLGVLVTPQSSLIMIY